MMIEEKKEGEKREKRGERERERREMKRENSRVDGSRKSAIRIEPRQEGREQSGNKGEWGR